MSAEAKALLGQVVFARRQRRAVLVNFLLDQPVRFPVRRLTAGLSAPLSKSTTIKDWPGVGTRPVRGMHRD